jgi:hypothetical protein
MCGCGCATGKLWWLKEFARTDPAGASLFMDKRVNTVARFLMPLLLLLCMALFISANTSPGASVYVLMSFGAARSVEIPKLFDFGLISSIRDMWDAGVYPLAIVIAFFSGAWPYIKLVLMLVTWLLPASLFKEKWREWALMGLDALGKWSLIDAYVMVVMLVSFHFHVVFPIVAQDYVELPTLIDVYVNAAWGFLAFLIATVLSLILSHIILNIHRHIKARPDENTGEAAIRYRPLFMYCNPKRFVVPIRIGIGVLLGVSLVLVILGVSFISFSFEFLGFAGWALGLLGISPTREYSIITLGAKLPEAVENPSSFTIRFTQLIHVLTAFVFPILLLVVLIVLWVVPLTRRFQKWIYTACEVINAWACIDVFVVSILAAILEIKQFVLFMVGDKCDFLTPYLEQFFEEPLEGHTTCFEVSASLKSGCWLLFIACIIYIATSMIVMRICRAALIQRAPPVKDAVD